MHKCCSRPFLTTMPIFTVTFNMFLRRKQAADGWDKHPVAQERIPTRQVSHTDNLLWTEICTQLQRRLNSQSQLWYHPQSIAGRVVCVFNKSFKSLVQMLQMLGLSCPSWKGRFAIVLQKVLTDLPAFYCTSKQRGIQVPVYTDTQLLGELVCSQCQHPDVCFQ